METPRKTKAEVDPAPALLLILVRHVRGWYEKSELADVLGVSPSQITMWERMTREVPYERLEQAFYRAQLPQSLIDPALLFLRAFVEEAKERDPDGGFGFEAELIAEMLSVTLAGVRQIREGLARAREEEERIDPQELWDNLKDLTHEERLFVVKEGREYQTRELAEWIAAREADDPQEAAELGELAQRVRELS